jgi:hepatocyte growth factor-regulated tyrosine kinase substrate
MPPSAPSASGPDESFYTGEQPALHAPPPHYAHQPTQTPQPHFSEYDKRASMPPSSHYSQQQQSPQRSNSWQTQVPSAPAPYPGPGYAPSEPHAQPGQQPNAPSQPLSARPPESAGTATADPNAAFYYNTAQQNQGRQTPSVAGDPAPSPYPNLQAPVNYTGQSVPPTPASAPSQPAPTQPSQPQPPQYQATIPQQQQPQQPYWQQPQHTGQAPQAYQTPSAGYQPGYTQESFPSAPRHAPQQPAIEESLIDL